MTRAFVATLAFGALLVDVGQAARQNLGALIEPDDDVERGLHSRAKNKPASSLAQEEVLDKSLSSKGARQVVQTVTRTVRRNYYVDSPPIYVDVPGVQLQPQTWPITPKGELILSNIEQQQVNTANLLAQKEGVLNAITVAGDTNANLLSGNQALMDGLGTQMATIDGMHAQNVADLASATSAANANAAALASNAANMNTLQNTVNANAASIAANANGLDALENTISSNAANIAANTNTINTLSSSAATNAANIAANDAALSTANAAVANNAANIISTEAVVNANTQAISAVSATADANSQAIVQLLPQVQMLSGSVAANTATISALQANVGVLNAWGGPTVALAGALGLEVSTVSTLALAGSFVGPTLGALALVYVCWPQPRNDPWWEMESRVAALIDDKFAEERRKRLGNRMKRYLKAFARCSSAWLESAVDREEEEAAMKAHSALQLGWHQITSGEISKEWKLPADPSALFEISFNKTSNYKIDNKVKTVTPMEQASPPCMSQLETLMSLERDEWMSEKQNSLSGLFMPFANLHTQIQVLLKDYPTKENRHMDWAGAVRSTAAEYSHFINAAMLGAWRTHMCRSVRLRYSPSTLWWQYMLTVLEPEFQPNAGESCWDECGGKSGWCNFCGGRHKGACCKHGAANTDPPQDPSECKLFDPPVGRRMGGAYHTCVHTECGQMHTEYHNVEDIAKSYQEDGKDWASCQDFCKTVPGSQYFLLKQANSNSSYKCKCQRGSGQRIYVKGSISGPMVCNKDHQKKDEDEAHQTEEQKQAAPDTPMVETKPCTLSPGVSDIAQLEDKHPDWVKACHVNVSKVVVKHYNPFYKRFAKFSNLLARTAGCMGEYEGHQALFQGDAWYLGISNNFDFADFSTCNWEREKRNDGAWVPDDEREEGWIRSYKISLEEQKLMKIQFPLPEWLEDRRKVRDCIDAKFPGLMHEEPGDAMSIGDAEENIVTPIRSEVP